jgi:glycosyltransferase involved in cell wall biosynthesis
MAERPFVSVAIPTWNRAEHLRICVESLMKQDYPRDHYEIIVVDDGSSDGTAGVVDSLRARSGGPAVRYSYQAKTGVNAARNAALLRATGDPICFVDDDEEVPPSWLAALVESCLRHPDAGCVGGPMRLRCEGRPPRTCGREPLGESELDYGTESCDVEYVWGGNMALRKAAVEEVGGFRQDLVLLGGTETEWQDRLHAAGGRVVYEPTAWLWHRRTQDQLRLRWLLIRHFRRGRGQAINGALAGQPFDSRRIRGAMRRALTHATRERCAVGLIDAARHAGRLTGMAQISVGRMDCRRSS